MHYGIDVSIYQGSIAWDEAHKSGACDFAYCKATEGQDWQDPTFNAERVRALRTAGVPFGAYHFARPKPGDQGAAEARFHVETVRAAGGLKPGDLPCALDIETAARVTPAYVRRWVREWVREYRRLTGHRPLIYTGSFWRDFMGNPVILTRCRLWLAAYTSTWAGWVPRAWKRPSIWQFTGSGHVRGVGGNVDRDVTLARRTIDRMRAETAGR